jgi:hypothetical protein
LGANDRALFHLEYGVSIPDRPPFECLAVPSLTSVVVGQDRIPYTTYATFDEVLKRTTAQYDKAVRVTSPGTDAAPTDHGVHRFNA